MNSEKIDLVVNGRFLSQETTGIQRVGREFVRSLDALIGETGLGDFDVRIVAPHDAREEGLKLRHIEVRKVGRLRGHAWEQLELPRHAGDGYLLCLGNVAPLATLTASTTKVALMLHDTSYRVFPKAYRRFYRYGHTAISPFLLRYANPIVTVSESERDRIAAVFPHAREKIVVAQNGSWKGDMRPHDLKPWAERAPGSYGLYVGSFSQRKNIDATFEVALRLARERGMPFVFIGSSGNVLTESDRQISPDVAHLITIRGHVESQDELEAIYRGASYLLFPSFYEASPLPPIEAMNFGCPVIASDIPSMRERCGDAATYCDPADRSSIHAAVEKVLDDPIYTERLVAAGILRAAQFSWMSQVEIVLNAIRSAQST